jgi:ankyrin repeat protein
MLDMGGYGSGARFLLELAVKKRDMTLARWLLARGADPNAAPARDKRFTKRSLYECAVMNDLPEMAELFVQYGALRSVPDPDENERFADACFKLDRKAARDLALERPEYLQSPMVMFEAAKRDRPDAIALLLDLGAPLEIHDKTGKRALHEAAYNNALQAVRFLVEKGAEIDPRESIYGATPIGWAAHANRTEIVGFLARYSRDIWPLCFNGFVDRVREILADDPSLARVADENGITPLWWLPDDDVKALAIVELLLAAGADPTAKSKKGRTAADWARRRGMRDVAIRLDADRARPPA